MGLPWGRRSTSPADRGRTRGRPRSSNGASSFHLVWELPTTRPLVEVSAVLEVLTPPVVEDTSFWALQVSFADRRADHGAAHLGLQWRSVHPRSRAVNWGGYASGGRVLDGSASPLPSAPDDPNTRDYPWEPGHPYRLRVTRAEAGWQGEVTDLATGDTIVVRELHAGGDRLTHPVVWSEVFAPCDAPSSAVRWTALEAVTDERLPALPRAVRVNYQSHGDGGCANTDASLDGTGLVQRTSTPRHTPHGAVLPLGST